ncbi:MAG: hypothetical protein AB7E70_20380 [Hyphomicrobiaceae bacterium]
MKQLTNEDLSKTEDAFIKYISAREIAAGSYRNAQDLKNKAGEIEQTGRDLLASAAQRVNEAVGEIGGETPRIRLGDDQLLIETPDDQLIVYQWSKGKGMTRCVFPPAGELAARTDHEGKIIFPHAHAEDRRCQDCGRVIRHPRSVVATKA